MNDARGTVWTSGLIAWMISFFWLHPWELSPSSMVVFAVLQLMLSFGLGDSRLPLTIWSPLLVAGQVVLAMGWLVDAILFRWSGHRLMTGFTVAVLNEHILRLWSFRSSGIGHAILGTFLLACGGLAFAYWFGFRQRENMPRRRSWVLPTLVLMLAGFADWQWAGPLENRPADRSAALKADRLKLDNLKQAIDQRARSLRFNAFGQQAEADRRDVVVVILESLRPELLQSDVMPATHALGQRGLWLSNHWSGGNATSLGMFSLFSGMEALWFYKSEVRHAPALNRLFHQAGYEIGLFASDDDWSDFQMGEMLSGQHYDVTDTRPRGGLTADRETVQAAEAFLDHTSQREPRLAVIYLYSTHAPFDVDGALATDQPSADAGFPIPYPPSDRQRVWNRYRNAARSLDRILRPLYQPDRVVLVTGDHGEAFLEDGTIGHGTQLSAVQLRTPALIAGGKTPIKRINTITTHADLLPTLIEVVGMKLTEPGFFDGIGLSTNDAARLLDRVVSVADYVQHRMVLLGPHSQASQPHSPDARLGWLCDASFLAGTFEVQSAIGLNGRPRSRPSPQDEPAAMNADARDWLVDQGLLPAKD